MLDERALQEQPIGTLVTQLIEDGKAYVRSEVTLAKTTVTSKVGAVVPSAAFGFGALLIVQASLTVLVAALGMTIAVWVGPAGGLAIGGAIGLLLAGLLGWIAAARLKGKL